MPGGNPLRQHTECWLLAVPPPVAMKKNPATGEWEEFNSAKLQVRQRSPLRFVLGLRA